MTSEFRGEPHIDGSFLSTWSDYYLSTIERPCLYIDWKKDPLMSSQSILSFVETLSTDGIWELVERGKRYAKVMEADGIFEPIPRLL